MGAETKIAWCSSTFSGWGGCIRVSPGSEHCYAERDANRFPSIRGVWGPKGTRVVRVDSYWRQPLLWDRKAAVSGERHLVFTASVSDVFEQWDGPMVDHEGKRLVVSRLSGKWSYVGTNGDHRVGAEEWGTMDDVRLRLFDTIRKTPNLTWLVLTKRIEHVLETIVRCAAIPHGTMDTAGWLSRWASGQPPANVWLGCTAEDQEWADRRVPELLMVPAVRRFVSYEPALGPVDWRHIHHDGLVEIDALTGDHGVIRPLAGRSPNKVDWLIVGGESGHHARPFDLEWARDAIRQCRGTTCVPFVKQLGLRPFDSAGRISIDGPGSHAVAIDLADKHGADSSEWPEDLRVREFPTPNPERLP